MRKKPFGVQRARSTARMRAYPRDSGPGVRPARWRRIGSANARTVDTTAKADLVAHALTAAAGTRNVNSVGQECATRVDSRSLAHVSGRVRASLARRGARNKPGARFRGVDDIKKPKRWPP